MATINKELVYRQAFESRNDARLAIFDFSERFYEPRRRHSRLGNIGPADYELTAVRATL